ncbi:DUF4760 domain-containing protein [Catenovulum sp. 2E275]|uniref:DUF4760 domain-containing protein n=1 Tax=Catenovulum sp. 2E275 TaxID=2980497 RepID=UPI0021CEB6DB|nr:DUF4760 domain-containing protein [Catenovulum sp. 2E275]MCU4675078.1 DUF4760 domain-containing protein [Catenovulum sp. 2E275]
MTIYEFLNILVQALMILIISLGFIYARKQFNLHARSHEWERMMLTQNAIVDFRKNQSLKTISTKLDYLSQTHSTDLSKINEAFDKDSELRADAHMYLNQIEILCAGMLNGVYEEKLIKDSMGNTISYAFEFFKDYIEQRRTDLSPNLYKKTEQVVKLWQQNKPINQPK